MKRISLFCFFMILAAGCAGKNKLELLTDRAQAYNQSLRWSSLTAASSMIAPDNRRSLIQSLSRVMAKQRIVDFSIVDLSMDETQKKGSILVEFSYFNLSDQNLRYRQEQQTWEYIPKQDNWFMSTSKTVSESTQE